MRTRSMAIVRLALPLLLLGGCFPYAPLEGPAPEPGADVRVSLARPRSFELLGFTAHDVQRVDGTLVRERSGALEVSADWVHAPRSGRFDGGGRIVSLQPEDVEVVEVRRHSWLRTGFVALLGSVAVYLGMEALQGASSTSDGTPGGGGEPR